MSLMGMMERDREKKPLMKPRDSGMKSAMKSVMKLGRANMPKMPKLMKRDEGM